MRLTEFAGVRISPGLRGVLVAGVVLALAALACGGSSSTDTDGSGSTGATPPTASSGQTKVASTGNAPPISAETFDHGNFDLAELAGQPVVVNFWFPSCPPCRAEMPDLQEAYTEFKDQGVQFVGIQQLGIDSKAAAISFLEEVGVEYPNIPDENAAIQLEYKILSYPTTLFLDRNHDIAKKWNGLIKKEDLREQIENIAGS
jgi:thiol-disulfide isomerase/thioredoxin